MAGDAAAATQPAAMPAGSEEATSQAGSGNDDQAATEGAGAEDGSAEREEAPSAGDGDRRLDPAGTGPARTTGNGTGVVRKWVRVGTRRTSDRPPGPGSMRR